MGTTTFISVPSPGRSKNTSKKLSAFPRSGEACTLYIRSAMVGHCNIRVPAAGFSDWMVGDIAISSGSSRKSIVAICPGSCGLSRLRTNRAYWAPGGGRGSGTGKQEPGLIFVLLISSGTVEIGFGTNPGSIVARGVQLGANFQQT